MHKQSKAMTTKLRNFVQILQVLPVSTVACERGFSEMNRPHTAVRSRLVHEIYQLGTHIIILHEVGVRIRVAIKVRARIRLRSWSYYLE